MASERASTLPQGEIVNRIGGGEVPTQQHEERKEEAMVSVLEIPYCQGVSHAMGR